MPASRALGVLVPVLVEVLETVVLHVVAAVGAEAVDGEGVAHLADGVGQQHAGLRVSSQHRVFLAWTMSLVDSDRSSSTRMEKSRVLRTLRIMMRGSGWLPRRMSVKLDGGVDVDLVAVLQLADALHALGLHGVQQELHAVDFPLVLAGDVVDELQVALLGALFQHRGPGRALQLDLVVPLGIVEGVGDGFLALQLVE
jgi:hypothetical protein